MIKVKHLNKAFGSIPVLRDLNLTVNGPLGQGKCLRTFKAVPCETLYRLRKTIKPAVVLQLLRQYRIILSADTASEVRQLLSQKRR